MEKATIMSHYSYLYEQPHKGRDDGAFSYWDGPYRTLAEESSSSSSSYGYGDGYKKEAEPLDYSVLSVGVMTLGLILFVEVIRHQFDHAAKGRPFFKTVLEGVYSECKCEEIRVAHQWYEVIPLFVSYRLVLKLPSFSGNTGHCRVVHLFVVEILRRHR